MRARFFALAAIALVLMWPGERLEATPVLEDPLQGLALNGFGIDFHEDVLGAYDSTLDELRISSLREEAEYRGPLGVLHTFTSFFELTAGVDEFGRVTDRGTVRWEGDFGSGRELLATGKLLDLGFDTAGFSLMRLLLDIEFLDARVSGLGGHVGFFFERQWPTVLASPFMEDWLCPSGGAEGPGCREPISTTGMAGVIANNIPEPESVALFGIALGLVGIWRRRV